MIIETVKQLCDIIKHALKNEEYKLPIINERELFTMAKENGLSGLVFTTLNNGNTPKNILKEFKNEHYVYIAQATRQEEALEDIKKTFLGNDIRHIFLKGSTIRELYPKPYMRSMGDIDILVDKKNMSKIHSLFSMSNYYNEDNSEAHDKFIHPNGSYIEIHPQITRVVEGLKTEIFNNSWEHSFIEKGNTYRLNHEYELTYLIYHAAKHFKSSGVGLRTLLDIGLYVKAYSSSIDMELLLKMFESAKISKFAANMIKLQNELFDIDTFSNVYKDIVLSSEFIDFMTRYIAISGTHGTGDKFNRIIGRIAKPNIKYPKSRFLIKSLFPSISSLTSQYAFIKNKWFLYPLGWIIRLLKMFFTRLRHSVTILRQLAIPKSHLDTSIKMFEELGL